MAKPSTPKSASAGTPATTALTRSGVSFRVHHFENDIPVGEHGYGRAAAQALGVDETRVFKTLLVNVIAPTPSHAVAVVPVSGQLSLKAMAAALGAERVEMLDAPSAERVTGYVVGGISPFGQRKRLTTVVDSSALEHPTVFVSGGRRGLDIEVSPTQLVDHLGATVAPIATD